MKMMVKLYLSSFFAYLKQLRDANDEDNLEYLTSLMSDDENDATEDTTFHSLQSGGANVEKPKGRIESGAFDEELDAVAKNRKRRSQEAQVHKKRHKRDTGRQPNDNRTALLEGG